MTLVIIFKIVKDGTSLQFTVSLINQTACIAIAVSSENKDKDNNERIYRELSHISLLRHECDGKKEIEIGRQGVENKVE